jgi:TPR repeat protein
MISRIRLLILVLTLFTLPGCIDQRLRPYVPVGDLVHEINGSRMIAEEGNADDQYSMGLRHEKASTPNYQEAVRWYRSAAMQRHPEAFYRLCVLSDVGRGLPQDYQEALRWCRLAADQGHGRAMYTIGIHYQDARGVSKDLVQAHQWYNLAAAYGYAPGAKWRDRLMPAMTAPQISQAQFLARNWKPTSLEPPPASP